MKTVEISDFHPSTFLEGKEKSTRNYLVRETHQPRDLCETWSAQMRFISPSGVLCGS